MDHPSAHRPDVQGDWDKIPQELKDRPQWIAWVAEVRDGKPTKRPLGSSTDPETWSSFETVRVHAPGGGGIGFVFSPDDPYVGIDLDHCLDQDGDVIETWAQEILDMFPDAYVETSPSGRGLHLIVRGSMPPGIKGKRQGGVEVYGEARFFTMTGTEARGEVVGEAGAGKIDLLLCEYAGWDGKVAPTLPMTEGVEFSMPAEPRPPMRFHALLEMDSKLKATWEGKRKDLKGEDGLMDENRVELALASMLKNAEFTDQEIVDTCRCWRITMASKPAKAGRRDYYDKTLARVRRSAVEEEGLERLTEIGESTRIRSDPDESGRIRVDVLVALNQTLGFAPEAGVEGLWRYPGDPPQYAIKAVGRAPVTIGPASALTGSRVFQARMIDLFNVLLKPMKAHQWAPICKALLSAVEDREVEEGIPQAQLLGRVGEYLLKQDPAPMDEGSAWRDALAQGRPLLIDGDTFINLEHVLTHAPRSFQREWTTTRMGRTLDSLGWGRKRVCSMGREKRYWKRENSTRQPADIDTTLETNGD